MTPGQAAYEMWASLVIPPEPLPWDALPSVSRDGWEKIAEEACASALHDRIIRAAGVFNDERR